MTDATTNGYSLGNGRLIRQVRDWQVTDGFPTLAAFMFERGKSTLSFNWFEKTCLDAKLPMEFDKAIIELEKNPPLKPVDGFMWAILSCDEIIYSVKEGSGIIPEFKLCPTEKDASHVIFWDWKEQSKKTRKKVAMNMAEKLTASNTWDWPVTPELSSTCNQEGSNG